jgi:hypothetical protein
MKAGLFFLILAVAFINELAAQKNCTSHPYQHKRLQENTALAESASRIEAFISRQAGTGQMLRGEGVEESIITIPVVIHNLYHHSSEKITVEQVMSQLAALNQCFRRRNADTVHTPSYFRSLAADCRIEFQLAISDPQKRSTTGIIRKYTPIKEWEADDKMKFSAEMGDDAWDPNSYLNIWVCKLNRVAGYASVPGDMASKDGVVIDILAFGTLYTLPGYEMGKTAVHEVAHWLGLRHLWGDQYCGDDGVADTPKQAGYNIECPNVINITCGNGPYGDMYMNYMDLTNDRCMNLFTHGQKARMRALFAPGGPRHKLLTSTGLNPPLINLIPLPEEDPRWLHPHLYPNPATHLMTIDLAYDSRWMGKTFSVLNLQGQTMMTSVISGKSQLIDISKLQAGIYFITAKKDDGESLRLKFLKF